ncbi:hypothetical protein R5H32_15975 [Defluviimonas sp. D31]|uniref:hypothetical protein n=1 Tax=Defluviimonas sp. D31 TaxID=3083253 RepID=UPI00296FF2A4|nr:hypothetical protein [Defluviimonas sp. D31]MDW4550860.1 hypothetical protein [Defluviimonas sp. D31]
MHKILSLAARPAGPRLATAARGIGAGAALFIAFSLGAAGRLALTGAAPSALDPVAVTLWGWPLGLPALGALAAIARGRT